jgi:hypothetical protein
MPNFVSLYVYIFSFMKRVLLYKLKKLNLKYEIKRLEKINVV